MLSFPAMLCAQNGSGLDSDDGEVEPVILKQEETTVVTPVGAGAASPRERLHMRHKSLMDLRREAVQFEGAPVRILLST